MLQVEEKWTKDDLNIVRKAIRDGKESLIITQHKLNGKFDIHAIAEMKLKLINEKFNEDSNEQIETTQETTDKVHRESYTYTDIIYKSYPELKDLKEVMPRNTYDSNTNYIRARINKVTSDLNINPHDIQNSFSKTIFKEFRLTDNELNEIVEKLRAMDGGVPGTGAYKDTNKLIKELIKEYGLIYDELSDTNGYTCYDIITMIYPELKDLRNTLSSKQFNSLFQYLQKRFTKTIKDTKLCTTCGTSGWHTQVNLSKEQLDYIIQDLKHKDNFYVDTYELIAQVKKDLGQIPLIKEEINTKEYSRRDIVTLLNPELANVSPNYGYANKEPKDSKEKFLYRVLYSRVCRYLEKNRIRPADTRTSKVSSQGREYHEHVYALTDTQLNDMLDSVNKELEITPPDFSKFEDDSIKSADEQMQESCITEVESYVEQPKIEETHSVDNESNIDHSQAYTAEDIIYLPNTQAKTEETKEYLPDTQAKTEETKEVKFNQSDIIGYLILATLVINLIVSIIK